MKFRKIIIIAVIAAALYLLYKRGVFSSLRGKDSDSDASLDSSAASLMGDIPSDALYADYKADLEFYVRKLDITKARELTASTYPTDDLFRKQVKAWVKNIWLSAKNNSKWTQESVRTQAAENGVTYNQQIVKDAVWQMGQAEKSKITGTSAVDQLRKDAIQKAFNELQRTVDDM